MSYFHWQIEPVLIHLGPLQIRWYGILFVSGLLIGFHIMRWIYKREGKDDKSLDDLLLYLIVGIVVGARLVHTLIYEPDYFLAHPVEILYVWKGGLASHGGLIGALIATYLYCKKYNLDFEWVVSRMTIPGAMFSTFVRIGNFFNSEILGKKATISWAVVFERIDNYPRHPVQLYEAFAYLIIFFIMLLLYLKLSPKNSTKILGGVFLILVFGVRFVLEFFKVRQADYVLFQSLSVGQLLSIPFAIFGVIWLIWGLKRIKERG